MRIPFAKPVLLYPIAPEDLDYIGSSIRCCMFISPKRIDSCRLNRMFSRLLDGLERAATGVVPVSCMTQSQFVCADVNAVPSTLQGSHIHPSGSPIHLSINRHPSFKETPSILQENTIPPSRKPHPPLNKSPSTSQGSPVQGSSIIPSEDTIVMLRYSRFASC